MTDPAPRRTSATGNAPPPVFLERQSYRRRRLMDAARLLPLIGAALFAVPLLWPRSDAGADAAAAGGTIPTSSAILYIFSVWGGLILINALFGWLARNSIRDMAMDEVEHG